MTNNIYENIYDIAVIGGGPAGLTAALYARRAGYSIIIFENTAPGGQLAMTWEVDNYPGVPKTDGASLALAMLGQAEDAGAELSYDSVIGIGQNENIKTVITENGELRCRALIIASGAKRRKLGVPGEDRLYGRGVSYCATCDGSFFRGKTVAVSGGGNTALEDAQYLSKLCEKVYLIHRRSEFRGSAANVERTRALPNVELILDSTVTEIAGDEKVTNITVNKHVDGSSRTLEVAAIFVAVGSIPDTMFIPEGMLETAQDGSIITDGNMSTSVSGIYAAGDVRNTPLRQIITAAADGAVAATSAGHYIGGL